MWYESYQYGSYRSNLTTPQGRLAALDRRFREEIGKTPAEAARRKGITLACVSADIDDSGARAFGTASKHDAGGAVPHA